MTHPASDSSEISVEVWHCIWWHASYRAGWHATFRHFNKSLLNIKCQKRGNIKVRCMNSASALAIVQALIIIMILILVLGLKENTRHTCNQEPLAGNFIHQSTLEPIILYRDLCGAVSGKGDKPLIKTGYWLTPLVRDCAWCLSRVFEPTAESVTSQGTTHIHTPTKHFIIILLVPATFYSLSNLPFF